MKHRPKIFLYGFLILILLLIGAGCGKKSNRSGAFTPAGSLPTSFSKGSPTVPDVVLQNGDFSLILPDADAARHFNIKVEQVENGKTRVTVGVRDLEQVSMLAFDVGFDPARYSPGSVKDLGFMGGEEKSLFLAVTDIAGRVPVGIARIRPQDNGFVSGSGDVFVVEFDNFPQGPAKAIRKPVTKSDPMDDNVVILTEVAGGFTWLEAKRGDWNNDGQVSATDLTPLATHFGESTNPIDPNYWVYAQDVDGDGGGLVAATDLTPIAVRFGERTDEYGIYEATDVTGTGATKVQTILRPTPPADANNPPWNISLAAVTYNTTTIIPAWSPTVGKFYRMIPADTVSVDAGESTEVFSDWTQYTGGGGPTVFSHLYEVGVNITVDNSPEIPGNPMEFDGDATVTDPATSGAFPGLPDIEYATDTAQTDFNARVYVSLAWVMVQPTDSDGNFIDSDPVTAGIQPYAPQLLDAANPSWDPTGTGQLILWTHYTDNNFAVTVDPVYFDSTGAGSSITLTPTQVFTPAQTVTITTHDVVPISNPSPPEKTVTADFISITDPNVPQVLQLRPSADVQLPVPLLLLQIIGEKLDQDTTPPSVGVFAVELVEDTGVLPNITKDTTPNKVTFQSVTGYSDPLFPTADSLMQADGVFITNDILFPDPNNPGEYLPASYHSIATNGFGRVTPLNPDPVNNTITFLPITPPPPTTDPKPAPTTFVEAATDRGTGDPVILTPGLYTDPQGVRQVGQLDVWYHYEVYEPQPPPDPLPQRLRVISPRLRLKDPVTGNYVPHDPITTPSMQDYGPPSDSGPFGDYSMFANPRYNNLPTAGTVLWHDDTLDGQPKDTRKAYKAPPQPWVVFWNWEMAYYQTWQTGGSPPLPSKQFTLEILTWPDSQIDPNSGNTIGPPTIKTQDIVLYNQHSDGRPSVKIDSLKNETQGPGWDVNQGQVVTDDVLVLEGSGFWWLFGQLTSDQDPIEFNLLNSPPLVRLYSAVEVPPGSGNWVAEDQGTPSGRLYYEYGPNWRLTRANTQLIKVKVPVDVADMPQFIDFVIEVKNPDEITNARDYDRLFTNKRVIRTG